MNLSPQPEMESRKLPAFPENIIYFEVFHRTASTHPSPLNLQWSHFAHVGLDLGRHDTDKESVGAICPPFGSVLKTRLLSDSLLQPFAFGVGICLVRLHCRRLRFCFSSSLSIYDTRTFRERHVAFSAHESYLDLAPS